MLALLGTLAAASPAPGANACGDLPGAPVAPEATPSPRASRAEALPSLAGRTLGDVVARALATSPVLAALDRAIEAQRLAVRLEGGAFWQKAQLRIGADADTRTGGVLQTSAAGVNGGVGVTLSLADLLATGDRVAKEGATLARLQHERDAAAREIRKAVAQRWFGYEAALAQAGVKGALVRAAAVALTRMRSQFADARATPAELASAQAALAAAEGDLARARADALTLWEELAILAGERDGAPTP